MRIGLAALVVGAGLAVAGAGSSASEVRIASYCSPSGDVCYGIFRSPTEVYRFELTTAAHYFSRYQVCVKPSVAAATCKSFPVRKRGANYGGVVIWNRNYPNKGPVRYKVTWKQSGRRFGPSLSFRVLPVP